MIPSPRPGRLPSSRRPAATPARPLLASTLLLALLAAACGPAGTSPAAPSGGPVATAPASGAPTSSAPGASSSQAAAQPRPTAWPLSDIEGLLVLGTADQDIKSAGGDLGAATANEDLQAMWGAADGLAAVLVQLPAQVDRIRDNPEAAELAGIYDEALPQMTDGATRLRDAITDGDAAAIAAASQTLSAGLQRYGDARPILAPLVQRAFLMQRLLVK